MKKTLCLLLTALFCLLPAACHKKKTVTPGRCGEDPQSPVDGWYAVGQTLEGGQSETGINLRDVSIQKENGATVVSLTFTRGSEDAPAEKDAEPAVPEYRLSRVDGLCRYVLSLQGVEYWDYMVYSEEMASSNLTSLFRGGVYGGQSLLFLTLDESCDFRTEEEGNVLRLYFTPNGDPVSSRWYVTVDGYDLYPGNEAIEQIHEMSFYPTLCSDGSSMLLVSKGFNTREDAETYLKEYEQAISRALPGRVCSVTEILGSEAPEYDEQTQITNLVNAPVGTLEGQSVEAEVLLAGGRFLAWSPVDPEAYLYVRTVYDMQDSGLISCEELWLHDGSDRQIMPGSEFSHVLNAAFSPDGAYIAVLDQNGQLLRTAEIITVETEEFVLLEDLGAGADTVSFAWAEDAPLLYCVTGEAEALRFMRFDFSRETPEPAMLGEAGYESDLALAGGDLLFIGRDADDEVLSLRAMPADGGGVRVLTAASNFLLSPDGQHCAVLGSGEEGEFVGITDLATGKTETLAQGGIVIDMQWDADGKTLYYSLYDPEAEDDSQPLLLYRAAPGGAPELLMNLVPGTLYPSNREKGVLLVYLFTQVNQSIAMTYRLDLER